MGRRLALAGLAAALLLAGGILWIRATLYGGSAAGDRFVEFHIPEGASLARVAEDLDAAGLISGSWKLRLVARLEGGDRGVHAGDYAIAVGSSPAEILELLVSGRVLTVPVTLVEGWTAPRSASVLAEVLGLDRAALDSLVASPPQRLRILMEIPDGHGLEGYLFPETYRFARGISEQHAIEKIVGTLQAALVDSMRSRLQERGLTLHELLTLASIVEAEATRDDERSSVAAVYHNRLREGWRLEADPTVAYVLGKQGERLIFRDLEVDSPYNTYRVRGLPPGPINSPGIASILATLWPRVDFEAMYFVADGSGGHRFSRTWEEHSAAVRAYRALQRQRRKKDAG